MDAKHLAGKRIVQTASNYWKVYDGERFVGSIMRGGMFGEGNIIFTDTTGMTHDMKAYQPPNRSRKAYKKFLGYLRSAR